MFPAAAGIHGPLPRKGVSEQRPSCTAGSRPRIVPEQILPSKRDHPSSRFHRCRNWRLFLSHQFEERRIRIDPQLHNLSRPVDKSRFRWQTTSLLVLQTAEASFETLPPEGRRNSKSSRSCSSRRTTRGKTKHEP